MANVANDGIMAEVNRMLEEMFLLETGCRRRERQCRRRDGGFEIGIVSPSLCRRSQFFEIVINGVDVVNIGACERRWFRNRNSLACMVSCPWVTQRLAAGDRLSVRVFLRRINGTLTPAEENEMVSRIVREPLTLVNNHTRFLCE
ncbi:hypothetical protein HID58_012128 [Brassica napus]|uniref:Uncharacterized protein n=1 Tax=Brassica napus TaxID=3708 RepID=A0ABQ8E057_BRANA|nr:hypothetical protein HID58_012128 [Brassica napus]